MALVQHAVTPAAHAVFEYPLLFAVSIQAGPGGAVDCAQSCRFVDFPAIADGTRCGTDASTQRCTPADAFGNDDLLGIGRDEEGHECPGRSRCGLDHMRYIAFVGRLVEVLDAGAAVQQAVVTARCAGIDVPFLHQDAVNTPQGQVDSLFKSASQPGSILNVESFGDAQSFPALKALLDIIGCLGPACQDFGYTFGNIIALRPGGVVNDEAQFLQVFAPGFGQGALVPPALSIARTSAGDSTTHSTAGSRRASRQMPHRSCSV